MIILRNKYFNEVEETKTDEQKGSPKKNLTTSQFITGLGMGTGAAGLGFLGAANADKIADKIKNSNWGYKSDKLSGKIKVLDRVKEEIKNSDLTKKIKNKKITSLELKRIPLVKKLAQAELKDDKLREKKEKISNWITKKFEKLGDNDKRHLSKAGKLALGTGLALGGIGYGIHEYKKYKNKKKEENDSKN